MESTSFNLNAALQAWRAQLGALSRDERREVESHLQDSMADLRSRGLSEQEAFQIATERLGAVTAWTADAVLPQPREPRWSWLLAGWGAMGSGVLCLISSLLLPKMYEAHCLVELVCEPTNLPTQRSILGSPETFLKAVRQLEPPRGWRDQFEEEAALEKRHRAVRLEPVPDTALVRITVSDEHAEQAAKLANAIPIGYESRKVEMAGEDRAFKLRALEEVITEQEMRLGRLVAPVASGLGLSPTISSMGGANFAFRPEHLSVAMLRQDAVAEAPAEASSPVSEVEAERILTEASLNLVKLKAEPVSQDAVIRLHERAAINHEAVPSAAVRQLQGWAGALTMLGTVSLWIGRGRPRWFGGRIAEESAPAIAVGTDTF